MSRETGKTRNNSTARIEAESKRRKRRHAERKVEVDVSGDQYRSREEGIGQCHLEPLLSQERVPGSAGPSREEPLFLFRDTR
jgi:hypothetical protein